MEAKKSSAITTMDIRLPEFGKRTREWDPKDMITTRNIEHAQATNSRAGEGAAQSPKKGGGKGRPSGPEA